MRKEIAADIAEVLVSPGYRGALNAAFEQDPDHYGEQQLAAEQVIFNAAKTYSSTEERAWETRRLAAITEMDGVDLGPFNDYFQDQGGRSKSVDLTAEDLGPGEPNIVRTNYEITRLRDLHDDPADLLESALDIIDDRRSRGKGHTGPENFATALKLAADKHRDSTSRHPNIEVLRRLVGRTLEGFVEVAATDPPNFVEMTNIYAAVRTLPPGAVDSRYSPPIVRHSLGEIPRFNDQTLRLSRAALSKLHIGEDIAEPAGTYVDLSMRKGRPFNTTIDFRYGARALANLPPGPAADRALRTFYDERNNLEEPLDLEGAEDVSEQLVRIVNGVTEDPELTQEAKRLAETCVRRAQQLAAIDMRNKPLTAEQQQGLKATVARVIRNYSRI